MDSRRSIYRRVLPALAVVGAMTVLVTAITMLKPAIDNESAATMGQITYYRDIAPILFEKCASCHRPNQSGPFPLLTYDDAKKRARQIADVTRDRYMPPWLPEPGHGNFANEPRLAAEQIELIGRWADNGAPEGDPRDLPAAPEWTDGWQIGEPDLALAMSEPHTLPADGADIYRNFVIPVPLNQSRYVRAVELLPGNPRVVHHAFVYIDATGQSRRADASDPEPGFGGMATPEGARMPAGHFLSWQPGARPFEGRDGLAWTLNPGADMVLQMHMRPTGREESIHPAIGFHFTDRPPTETPFKLFLTSLTLDIPPGETNYIVKDSYELPVDLRLIGVLPHAHYLAREMKGYAMLPDGTKEWLIWIKDWDFNWQGDYRYASPVHLPKGSRVVMEFSYDNSAANPRNPSSPPRRVRYGPQSSDEMAELWFQALTDSPEDLTRLERDYGKKSVRVFLDYNQHLVNLSPASAQARLDLGKALLMMERYTEAVPHLRAAANVEPSWDEPHYFLGLIHRIQNRHQEAKAEFSRAIELNPRNLKAHGNLGFIFLEESDLDRAENHFKSALEVDPSDALTREGLDMVRKARGKIEE